MKTLVLFLFIITVLLTSCAINYEEVYEDDYQKGPACAGTIEVKPIEKLSPVSSFIIESIKMHSDLKWLHIEFMVDFGYFVHIYETVRYI